ncbi:MAG: hypothetical protein WDA07_00195 [Leucobacter sp.]
MSPSPAAHPRSQVAWRLLSVLLALEALLLAWTLVLTLIALVGADGAALQNFSLAAMTAIALLWVLVTLVAAVRTRPGWARGSAVTIHVLLFAAGTGMLQLQIGPAWLGFAVIGVALAGFFLALVARTVAPTVPE